MSVKNIRTAASAFVFTFICAAASLAQTPTPTPKVQDDDENAIVKVNSRLVVVPVSVTDSAGQPVPGLKLEDFRIAEEGRQQKLENIGSADKVPLEIVLLFDVSASTDAMFKFEQETAAQFLKDVMRPEDRATIFSIGQKPQLIQGRDTAERATASVISITPTKGATAFFDTMREAAAYMRKNAPSGVRRVMVVISDGEDNFSEAVQRAYRAKEDTIATGDDPEFKKRGSILAQAQQNTKIKERNRVLQALQNADSVFYSINPAGSSYQLNSISVFGQENMQQFADQTGGSAFLPKFQPIDTKDQLQNTSNMRKNKTVLEGIFRQLANELRAQYLVQYYSESEFPLNKYVKLDVGLNNRGPLRVRARQGYFVKE
jgi:VWFA-related protein